MTTTFEQRRASTERQRGAASKRSVPRRPDRPTERSARHVAALPIELRRLRRDVLAWSLREARPIGADALSAVLGAKLERVHEPLLYFDDTTVAELLWIDIYTWCAVRFVELPELVAPTMLALFDYLDAHEGFRDGSDPVEQLCEPLVDAGGLSPRHRSRDSMA